VEKYFILLLSLLVCGCADKKNGSSNLADKALCERITKMNSEFDSIFVKTAAIVPDLGADNNLGWINQAKIINNNIYISDPKGAAIYILTMEGKFIAKIGNKGNGPGEFITLRDFDVDNSGYVYVLDSSNLRVSIFEKNNFIKSFPVIFATNICADYNGGAYLYKSGVDIKSSINALYHYNGDGKMVKEFCSPFSHVQMSGGKIIRDYDGNIYVNNVSTYLVKRFGVEGNLLNEYKDAPLIFKELDVKGRWATRDELNAITSLIGMTVTKNNLLILQYYRPEPKGNWIDIYCTDGTLLKRSLKIGETQMLNATSDDENIYFVEQPVMGKMFTEKSDSGFKIIGYKIRGSK
jgi:hypothetical protein